MRVSKVYKIHSDSQIKDKLLRWAQQFREVALYTSNNYPATYSKFNWMLGVDAFTSIQTDAFSAFETLQEYQHNTKDYILGFLTYDLKNGIEKLESNNPDGLEFPDLFFFQPKKLFFIAEDQITLSYLPCVDDELDLDWEEILNTTLFEEQLPKVAFTARTPKKEYLQKIQAVLQHIHRGDIYEANYCQEFFATAEICPLQAFNRLNAISNPPFASFFKWDKKYAICASPERYIQKTGSELITQPIKGTAKRSTIAEEDLQLKTTLENDPKERAENVMIVDLVRNDLAKTAQKGSVQVKELCKIYTFNQVHQMISTVTSTIRDEVTPTQVLQTTFPMGSMTGAPKISAMQICEKLEDFKRGLYSGAIGYFTPNGDFDFNVVIRTILYNAKTNYISYGVGGAITAQSIPENEYNECLIKAKALFSIFKSDVTK